MKIIRETKKPRAPTPGAVKTEKDHLEKKKEKQKEGRENRFAKRRSNLGMYIQRAVKKQGFYRAARYRIQEGVR